MHLSKSLTKKRLVLLFIVITVVLIVSGSGLYYLEINKKPTNSTQNSSKEQPQQTNQSKSQSSQSFAYILVAYKGQVFGAKVPKGWSITDNESGIDIMDPADNNTGATGAVAVGWYGYQTPDGFISFMVQAVGGTNMKVENESAEESVKDTCNNLTWKMKTKTFTFQKNGKTLKAKASAGVLNGYGQFMGMIIAFQTTPDKWS